MRYNPAGTNNNNSKERGEMNCKPIPGCPGYEISDCGRVFSTNGGRWKTGGRKELQQFMGGNRRNRPTVRLPKQGKFVTKKVHRLVLEVFVGPCPAGMEACHNDGNTMNNHLSNLRWDTRKNNMADKHLHGTMTIGIKNGCAKLSELDVLQIRNTYAAGGITQSKLARQFGVTQVQISHIVLRKLWTHI